MVFVQVNLTTPYLFFIVPSTRVIPKPENKTITEKSYCWEAIIPKRVKAVFPKLPRSLTLPKLPILNRKILAGSKIATREYDNREFSEFKEFKEFKEFNYFPITP